MENIFRKISIFRECYFQERKIFSGVWLHSKIFFGKYFLVFGCILENALKNPILSCFLHFLAFSQLPNKYIINSNKIQIHQNPNSQYPTKKISSNQRSVRVREQQNKNHPRHQRRIDPEQADRRFGGTILGLTNGASRVHDDR